MRVLVACEFSGRVRDAFLRRGHAAISCDLLPSETPGPHIQGDVLALPHYAYDLLIAFPPCTYLSYAAGAVWHAPGRAEKRAEAAEFVRRLAALPIPRYAIENPRGALMRLWRWPDAWFEPHWFGDGVTKRTYLWLNNVPPLLAGGIDTQPVVNYVRMHTSGARNRSRTFPGVAEAMAQQWGWLA